MKWLRRRSDKEKLVALLLKAEKRLRAIGDEPVWSCYGSGSALADFVARARNLHETDVLDHSTLEELWCVFAPTCDWDDVVGDVGLGQAVFESIEKVYGSQLRSTRCEQSVT